MSKILVIDDKPDNLKTIKALLDHIIPDCQVFTTLSGKEGIEVAKKENPDTIILDIIMPGMDGYEVCRYFKSDPITKNIPILMLTAIKTDTESRIKGLQHGADAFFSKPIDPYELGAQVEVLLRIKKSEDQLRQDKYSLLEKVDDKTRELLENEIKLNQIIQGFSIPSFIIDINHNITHWNFALERLTGLSAYNMIGTNSHWKTMYKKEHPLLSDLVLERLPSEEFDRYFGVDWKRSEILNDAYEMENFFIDSKERERWFYSTAVPIKENSGAISCALQTIQDITDRKKKDLELRKYQTHLEDLVKERTRQLEDKNEELEKINRLFSGREFRIKELREKIKKLEKHIGELEDK